MTPLPSVAGRVQKVVLRVDPHAPTGEIHLRTDHPDQPEVTINVVVLGESAKEGER